MNYKKDKSYIKQRLEYISPIDYISELEEKVEYLEEEIKRLENIIKRFRKQRRIEYEKTKEN